MPLKTADAANTSAVRAAHRMDTPLDRPAPAWVTDIVKRLDTIQTDVASLKTDVASIKTDVASLKTDVASIKAKAAETDGHLQRMDDDTQTTGRMLFDLQQRMDAGLQILKNDIETGAVRLAPGPAAHEPTPVTGSAIQ